METESDRLFHVVWSVHEVVNGSGDGLSHGDRRQIAQGEVTKSAASGNAIRTELLAALKGAFPKHVMGGTFELDRVYDVSIRDCSATPAPAEKAVPGESDLTSLRRLSPLREPALRPTRPNPTIVEVDSSPGWLCAVVLLVWGCVLLLGIYAALLAGGVIR